MSAEWSEVTPSRDDFLASCRESSAAAYDRFEALLSALEDPGRRGAARRLLSELEEFAQERGAEESLESHHFAFRELPASLGSRKVPPVTLLLFPSVFAPEQWSRTFFEGLARLPESSLEGRVIAELGSGSGWIALALARSALPRKVYGLDINPRSVTCARINLYHNALDAEGKWLRDSAGQTLLDRVEFYTSDLLGWVREQQLKLDLVIGCIPQVLDPGLEAVESAAEETSDELLLSLGNYTSRQGYLEDRFGLGLIARAIDESVAAMRANGRVVFNLGGRPGRSLLFQLFRRRGFDVREIWKTRIPQALDTDISPLADIETRSPHRFEFFMGPHGEEPIGARTAQAYQRGGGKIFHALTVLEGKLRYPEALQRLYTTLSRSAFRRARSALDLAFDADPVAEEKTAFLARLADLLVERDFFPYEKTLGARGLRQHFSQFLGSYLGIPVSAECFAVTPGRASALGNFLTLFAPPLALIHPDLIPVCPVPEGSEVLECPTGVDFSCQLIEAIQPQVVVTRLAQHEMRSPDSLLRLMRAAGDRGARLVVDLSAALELTSTPRVSGALRALAAAPLPDHVTILFSLDKNRVYADLEVCILMSESSGLLSALAHAAEVTYSRTPLMVQDYFDTILGELLGFRLDTAQGSASVTVRRPREEDSGPLARRAPVSEACLRAFEHPALAVEVLPMTAQTLRLDYGENALPSPDLVRASLFESFASRRSDPAEGELSAEIGTFLRRRFGISSGGGSIGRPRLSFGLGVSPLFASVAQSCAREAGTFIFPMGAYGHFVAAVEFFGGQWQRVETRREDAFKMTPEDLDRALARAARPWLFLNGPVVNPTGSVYSAEEVAGLLAVAAKHRTKVVLDVLFSGLEFDGAEPWELDTIVDRHPLDLILLGGISKELSAGGLRFGFAYCTRPGTAEALFSRAAAPHSTMLAAARQIFSGLNRPTPDARGDLETQRATLKEQAWRLAAALTETGWDPLAPQGGLFLAARPTSYLGRRLKVDTPEGEKDYLLDAESLPEALFYSTGLLINNSVWTGLPEHCRLVYSVPRDQLEAAIGRLREFHQLVFGR